jgi:hypothetical protein
MVLGLAAVRPPGREVAIEVVAATELPRENRELIPVM